MTMLPLRGPLWPDIPFTQTSTIRSRLSPSRASSDSFVSVRRGSWIPRQRQERPCGRGTRMCDRGFELDKLWLRFQLFDQAFGFTDQVEGRFGRLRILPIELVMGAFVRGQRPLQVQLPGERTWPLT